MTSVLPDVPANGVADGRSSPDRLNLMMFGDFWLDGIWYSRHHLAVGLARRHRVVLVDPPRELRSVALTPSHLFRRGRLRPDRHGTERYTPPGWLPDVYRWPQVRRTFYQWRGHSLLREIKGGPAPIRYVWNPACQEAVEPLAKIPLVYHAYDKYDQYTDATKDEVGPREKWLVQHADVCIAASVMLGEYLREIGGRNVHVVRHGVDTTRFYPGRSVPPRLTDIPRPRIGVVARFNEVLDAETLLHVATRRPGWSVVLVGGDSYTDPAKHRRFQELCRLPNVYHLGLQPRETIPQWMAGLDVGLACYDMGTWVPYSQPIKMYEYLACGLPVVASDLVATRELGDLIERCTSPEEWVSAIQRALEPATPQVLNERMEFAKANSWENRVSQLEGQLRRLI